jgi:dihydrofolate reductase
MKNLSIIVAVTDNGVIGTDPPRNLWKAEADHAYFQNVTAGHTVIMGRKTLEAMGGPMPDRRNIVITSQADFAAPGCEVAHSIAEALQLADDDQESFVIGGGGIYAQALPFVDKLYITEIHGVVDGTVKFIFDPNEWTEVSRDEHPSDAENEFPYSFVVYVRKN